jgi:hypothetical protein
MMMTTTRPQGHVRLERGHRHLGASVGERDARRHYGFSGLIATLIATAVSTYATLSASQAQQQAAQYQAKVQKNEAIAAQQAADQAAQQDRERSKRIISANIAAAGASGIQSAEGSPLLALVDQAQQAELNARTIEASGSRTASGFQSQALLSNFYARNFQTAGYFQAGSTLLTGAKDFSRAYRANQPPTSVPDYGGGI